jgi:hypothetical protein
MDHTQQGVDMMECLLKMLHMVIFIIQIISTTVKTSLRSLKLNRKFSILCPSYLIYSATVALRINMASTQDNLLGTGLNMESMPLIVYLCSSQVQQRIYAGCLSFRVTTLIVTQISTSKS